MSSCEDGMAAIDVLTAVRLKSLCALDDRNTLVNFPNSYNRAVKVSLLLPCEVCK